MGLFGNKKKESEKRIDELEKLKSEVISEKPIIHESRKIQNKELPSTNFFICKRTIRNYIPTTTPSGQIVNIPKTSDEYYEPIIQLTIEDLVDAIRKLDKDTEIFNKFLWLLMNND